MVRGKTFVSRFVTVVGCVLGLGALLLAEGPQAPAATGAAPGATAQTPNGISVGRPKVFDNRALMLMLENLSETLRRIEAVDQKTLASALANFQGFQSREFVSSLSVTPLPLPGTSDQLVTNTGRTATDNTALPDTTQRTQTTTQNAFTPQPPALDTVPAFSGFTPTYGQSSSDLLNDQVNLSYQIFNIRMVLERALSDRLLAGQNQTRLQAVLGFNITVDPPRTAEDSVAVVEVTVDADTTKSTKIADGLSLVALMPQEKTYNAAALSTRSNAFGGAAVAKLMQVGYNQRSRGQTFYVYRDTDTVAYERMEDGDPNRVTFGWMFRPVLGRKAVSPGMRQLFAVVSLPASDLPRDQTPHFLSARVRTYWKKYDADSATSYEARDANRAARLRYAVSLGLGRPEVFQDRYANCVTYGQITVNPTARYQNGLEPTVERVTWELVGPKSVLVSATGNNFFTGTQVTLAGKAYTGNGDGLVLKSNQAFDLTTTMEALEMGTGAIVGRYGTAVPLRAPCKATPAPPTLETIVAPAMSGFRQLTVTATGALPAGCGDSRVTPVLSVNGTILPPPYNVTTSGQKTIFVTHFSDALLADGGGAVKIGWPFLPTEWTSVQRISDPDKLLTFSKLSAKVALLTTTSPLGFTRDPNDPQASTPGFCWSIVAGDVPVKLRSTRCADGAGTTAALSSHAITVKFDTDVPDRIVVVAPNGAVTTVPLAKESPAAPKEAAALEVNQFDAVWVTVPTEDPTKVASVEADRKPLRFRAAGAGKTPAKAISVEFTRELTNRPGTLELSLMDGTGKVVGQPRVKVVCTVDCDAKER